MLICRYTILLLVFCANMTSFAQKADSIMQFMVHAMRFNEVFSQEKVYLHFDNTGYFKGERIWFKAYVVKPHVEGTTTKFLPSDISKVLYVELLNSSGDVVERKKLAVENGQSNGDILLNSILGSGFYEVRAYTRYMLNWGEHTVFSRVFPVFQAPQAEGDYSQPTIDQLSFRQRLPQRSLDADDTTRVEVNRHDVVRFFPEGGDLVKGLNSRVAFTISDEQGEWERGRVEVTPTDEESLNFEYTDRKGKLRKIRMPEAKEEGCVLRWDTLDTGSDYQASVLCSSPLHGRLLGYALMHEGSIVACDTFRALPQVRRQFSLFDLPAGVNQLTVFDSDGRIQAERLFFIPPYDAVTDSIHITSDVKELTPCGKVSLQLKTQPNASLSFSAMDAGTMVNGKETDICSWMLLSSDLKGYIAHPEYYFEANDAAHREAADLLMMIQGWRRYNWQVMAGATPMQQPLQPIEDHLYVFGQLRPDRNQWKKKLPLGGVELTANLYNSQGEHLKGTAVTDSMGNYAFQLPSISGDWNLLIQSRLQNELKNYTITIDRRFTPQSRYLFPEESQRMDVNEPNFFVQPRSTAEPAEETKAPSHIFKVGRQEYVTSAVNVKAKRTRWNDYTRRWYDESVARSTATLFYNCSDDAEEMADRGEATPGLLEWLRTKNPLFSGNDYPDGLVLRVGRGGIEEGNEEKLDLWEGFYIDADVLTGEKSGSGEGFVPQSFRNAPPSDWLQLWSDGLSYKNRPIVWIVNNQFCTITTFNRFYQDVPVLHVDGDLGVKNAISHTAKYCDVKDLYLPGGVSMARLPENIDEVKSVYISEDQAMRSKFIHSSVIDLLDPVTVYVYTYPPTSFNYKKGVRRTHFQGFNQPTTFEMEDYSILPPMEDFRRTLFWAPNVQADSKGHATIEFFNNSTCRELFISAEGLTPQGQFVIF